MVYMGLIWTQTYGALSEWLLKSQIQVIVTRIIQVNNLQTIKTSSCLLHYWCKSSKELICSLLLLANKENIDTWRENEIDVSFCDFLKRQTVTESRQSFGSHSRTKQEVSSLTSSISISSLKNMAYKYPSLYSIQVHKLQKNAGRCQNISTRARKRTEFSQLVSDYYYYCCYY